MPRATDALSTIRDQPCGRAPIRASKSPLSTTISARIPSPGDFTGARRRELTREVWRPTGNARGCYRTAPVTSHPAGEGLNLRRERAGDEIAERFWVCCRSCWSM